MTPPPSAAPPDMAIRRMDMLERDLLLFKKAFDANGSPRALLHLQWQYLEPPAGHSLVLFAEQGVAPECELAAIYATYPVVFQVNGQRVRAMQSLNTLTDAAHRGKGLFYRLASQMFEQVAPAQGVSSVHGFPNGNSAPGFFGRLQWTRLDPVPFMLKPLRTRYVARRIFGAAWSRWIPDVALSRCPAPKLREGQVWCDVEVFDAAFDELWAGFSRGTGFSVVRDSAYLNWRTNRPGARYQTQALYEHGQLLGFVITSMGAGEEDGRHGHVMELIYDPSRADAGRLLLQAALHRLCGLGADMAVAWNLPGSPNHRAFVRAGFLTVPRRFHPIELHFGVRWLAGPPPAGLADRRRWYISYLDCDTK